MHRYSKASCTFDKYFHENNRHLMNIFITIDISSNIKQPNKRDIFQCPHPAFLKSSICDNCFNEHDVGQSMVLRCAIKRTVLQYYDNSSVLAVCSVKNILYFCCFGVISSNTHYLCFFGLILKSVVFLLLCSLCLK